MLMVGICMAITSYKQGKKLYINQVKWLHTISWYMHSYITAMDSISHLKQNKRKKEKSYILTRLNGYTQFPGICTPTSQQWTALHILNKMKERTVGIMANRTI